jgi:hypothetical protein
MVTVMMKKLLRGGVGGGRLSYPSADSFMCGNDATFGYSGGCIYDPY